MPFSNRVFCRNLESPSLSELVVWLRQYGLEAQIRHAQPAGDLLSSFWERVELQIGAEGPAAPPMSLECLRADATGMQRLAEALADFVTDVRELPDTSARARVLAHLAATRSLVVVEFSPAEGSDRAEVVGNAILTLFVERADGLAQRDGAGFLDEDDDVFLSLP